jgi:hypothetical protein
MKIVWTLVYILLFILTVLYCLPPVFAFFNLQGSTYDVYMYWMIAVMIISVFLPNKVGTIFDQIQGE